ncbi:geranylgeranylglyceryl/heptaprenylglyceryl phosphate synthase [Streptomyces sp. MUM 203J]|uniref:geranylgeranylglyceryl/heptaprenylglyceryl phosphate synthase n=1 Tax=Streptomyces sp. MUM 203J TaxID=2791990 RepID=UPI001F03FA02|nr:geranylgeranylglyceryl/heptaprenylglyceryl phosphate synthase [Streptomyces sp. MUM 203J]MCH0541462.1 geranylgeranylglyceryl/heptaprenylglyceryl phosphate synthase [Streptomyces sp. MUM 203J]
MNASSEQAGRAGRAEAPALPPRTADILDRLRGHTPGAVPVIDPFRTPQDEALEKAAALTGRGFPAVILGGGDDPARPPHTSYASFTRHMEPYVAAVKAASGLPVLLDFPPCKGTGFPLVRGADAVLLPARFGSPDVYHVWQSYLETVLTLPTRLAPEDWPGLVLAAALTPGDDLAGHADLARRFGLDLVRLSARHAPLPPDAVRTVRQRLAPHQLLLVQADGNPAAYREAGADYVTFDGMTSPVRL